MPEALILWPEQPGLSMAVAVTAIVLAMYGARAPAHRMIQGLARAINQGCKLTAEAIMRLHDRLSARNRARGWSMAQPNSSAIRRAVSVSTSR